MKNLLLVEDDASLGATLSERLKKENYQTDWARSGEEAMALFKSKDFDLVLLDLGLPDASGFDVMQSMKTYKLVPFIFMTALNSAENRLLGYEMGADEFIPKPFHLREVLLRVKHVLDNHYKSKVYQVGSMQIDMSALTVQHDDGEVERLQSRDADLLQLLINASPLVLSRDEILNRLWGEDQFPSQRTIDNMIVRLRSILRDQQGDLIKSVRGVGYQWLGIAKEGNSL